MSERQGVPHPQDVGRVLVASNRGPVSFSRDADGALTASRGGGGLVSGLSSVAATADLLWICAALSDADRAAARRAPGGRLDLDGNDLPAAVQMLDIPAADLPPGLQLGGERHLVVRQPPALRYPEPPRSGHGSPANGSRTASTTPPSQRRWRRAPTRTARARWCRTITWPWCPACWPGCGPDVRIAHFSHTPWAPPDYFRILPDEVGRELLEGMLGADHAGFLSRRWADAFLDCCEEVLGAEVDRAGRQVSYRGHVCGVGVHPLGVDAADLRRRSAAADVAAQVEALTETTGGRQLIVRVDRTELSKNIVRGLAAYRELLAAHPELHGTGHPPGLRLPVPARPARVPRLHRQHPAGGRGRSTRSSARGPGTR